MGKNKKILLIIGRMLGLLMLATLASNIVWEWVMERLGLVFPPTLDAFLRIVIVVTAFAVFAWSPVGEKTFNRLIRWVRRWFHKPSGVISTTPPKLTTVRYITTAVIIGLCFTQYNFLVQSAVDRQTSSNEYIAVTREITKLPIVRYELLLEFGVHQNDIDPVDVEVTFSSNSANGTYAWWDSQSLKSQSFQTIAFNDSTKSGSIITRQAALPPVVTFYSLGKPLTRTNSLYLAWDSPQPIVIDSVVFAGKHYLPTRAGLVLDRR